MAESRFQPQFPTLASLPSFLNLYEFIWMMVIPTFRWF